MRRALAITAVFLLPLANAARADEYEDAEDDINYNVDSTSPYQQQEQDPGYAYPAEYAQQYGVGYYGPHPVPYENGSGFCNQQGAHTHEYPPFDQHLFREYNGYYYFVGDPADFGWSSGDLYWYQQNHPIPAIYGGGYCYMTWPHRHYFQPVGVVGFSLVDGYWWYSGAWASDYWLWRAYYWNYYGGYYRRTYYGNRYYHVRPPPAYRVPRPVRVAAPPGRVFVASPPAPVRVQAPSRTFLAPTRFTPPQARTYAAPGAMAPGHTPGAMTPPAMGAPMHQAPVYNTPGAYRPPTMVQPTPTYTPPAATYRPQVYTPPASTYRQPTYTPPAATYHAPSFSPPASTFRAPSPAPSYQRPSFSPAPMHSAPSAPRGGGGGHFRR